MRLLAVTLVATLATLALAGSATARVAAADAKKPTCVKPAGLTFARKLGRTDGLLRWKRPRRLPADAAGYRVLRNGKVVGQTRRLRMRLKVKAGAKVRFGVKVALKSGRALNCSARIARRLPWKLPGPTSNLIARPTETGVVLEWERARRGEGKLVGYRIFKDGKALQQVRKASLALALPSLRTFTFAVAAVDSRGKLGKRSNRVRVRMGHQPPTIPPGLFAEPVNDREIQLRWQPSEGTRGVRVFYRVLRDGLTVAQTSITEARVANLAPGTNYAFTVLAIDSLGYASEATSPVTVATNPPEQTSGGAHVFLLASTDASFRAFQQHYRQIHTVYPTYFDCQGNGSFVGRDDPLISRWARLRGVKVHARWNCQRTWTLNRLLNSPSLRTETIDRIAAAAAEYRWDGINLDFEAGLPRDRDAYSSFVRDLAARLHAQGTQLSVDVSAKFADVPNHPRSTFFDYDALSAHADRLFVMAWGKHWSTSAPGAIAEWNWVRKIADYVSARPRRGKYILGFGMYGLDWPNGGGPGNTATALEYQDVVSLAERVGARPEWDSTQQAPYFTYSSGGTQREVWYTNGRSLALRIELAHARGFGIGFWRLGKEDRDIWRHPLLQPGVAWP